MTKTQKKLDNKIVKVLTQVCERAKVEVDGFEWLTHIIEYTKFPDSLCVVCVFSSDEALATAKANDQQSLLSDLIVKELAQIQVSISAKRNIRFNSEDRYRRDQKVAAAHFRAH